MRRISPIWHPMTQHKICGPALHVDSAAGARLKLRGGQEIIDGISSWWVNTHGHCHPKIVEAVRAQAGKLEQVIFAGFTHDPAEKLTRKLLSTVHGTFEGKDGSALDYVFYSDSGSTAIEVALKMAIGFHENAGEQRHKVIALEGGYHGDTFGAMAAGSRSVFNVLYEPFLFDVKHVPFPKTGEEMRSLAWLDKWLKKFGSQTAAFVFEPLVQGAAGMRVYSPKVLGKMAQMCREHGVLLIADEVMTGFGRTGSMFACEQADFTPDLLCLSKGLTGGFLPMGATLATEEIYKAFYHDEKAKQFFHSTSFTGNPLACVAALASLEIWDEEPVMEQIAAIEASHLKAAGWYSARPDVMDVRVKGSIFAIDVRDDVNGYLSSIGHEIYDFMLANGVLLRPIGNTVYILPPYCIDQQDLECIYETLWRSLDSFRNDCFQQAA
ncbi:MAG TPA: adenosylmethionine--8-amino-7-oxononanoate transaminase [Alphaproteobacteria bacterium]|nr:MAG: adenosylmethionine--8-amino-7-oxononanoate transaminase [Rhodospirillales bacterium]HOO81606.1 adenosylmethionine--8-amino-7-oxononanoate transaminase [Alphaproteobacteria bacterium]